MLLGMIVIVGMLMSGSAFAQTSGGEGVLDWIGTTWISVGQTVSAISLKSNLDYLYNVKAPKPENCTGASNFLGWINGGWVCNEVGQPLTCSFNGTNVAHGNTVTAYQAASVPFGESCRAQERSCSNGVLSGGYQFASCSAVDASQCSFAGGTVEHGSSVTAYRAASVPFGQTCQSETRSCSDGSLSGSYAAASCVEVPAASCEFDGAVVPNGSSVVAYEFANVPFGQTCQSQTRTCTNGTLAGSYEAESCTVQPAATCVFDGATVQNGQSVEAYAAGSVPFGQSCSSETRTCSDGTLSGSNTFGECVVEPRETARFYQRDFVVQTVDYYCMEESFLDGESAWTRTERDSNNECPGWFSFERESTIYHLENHPGIRYNSNRYEGRGHDLASDSGTLLQLCKLKGYNYVTGQATRSGRSGFRELTSPGNNRLTYGRATARFSTTGVTINQTFNGRYGWVECSNTPGSSGSGGSNGGGSGGGENNGGGRDANLDDNESR